MRKADVIFFIILIVISVFIYKNTQITNQIDREGIHTVGYIYDASWFDTKFYNYRYYVNHKKYEATIAPDILTIEHSKIKKYYLVKYLKNNPEKHILYLKYPLYGKLKIKKFKEDQILSHKLKIKKVVKKAKEKIYN